MTLSKPSGYITIALLLGTCLAFGVWHSFERIAPEVQTSTHTAVNPTEVGPLFEGDFVVVNLRDMKLDLRHGTTTLASMTILTIGKPESYYETIGGVYESDYTIKNHFSTIGHVYMPWSVHVFGNFFIHGIPYYTSGVKVSSEYSGGCIRLTDADAKQVYEFVHKGTPIVVTKENENDFIPTEARTNQITSLDMTRLMVATVSLEVLTQDDRILGLDGKTYTTRRTLLPELILDGNDAVGRVYAQARGEETFVMYMNMKAHALGLTNTSFTTVDAPATTTQEDMERFTHYLTTYKTYLLSFGSSTQRLSR